MSKKKNILVTGGLGYIGSHTVVELIGQGYEVTIIDNLVNSRIEILDQIEKITKVKPIFHKLDLLDFDGLNKLFQSSKFDAVIHFAAHLLVDESVSNPLKYYRNNLLSLINLLEIMELHRIKNIIFSSSCTVYGNPEKFPVSENTSIGKASSPYGSTKIMGEQIIEDTVKASSNLNGILLRYFNPVGAHESGLIGELTIGNPKHLFPILGKAFRENKSFKVFGNDYNTGDGTAVRDYIHVVDLANAHASALEKMLSTDANELKSYNISTGKGLSVLQIINEFNKESKQNIDVIFEKRRAGDVEKIWAEPTLAKKELGWEPQYALNDMVSSALKWENYQLSKNWK